MQAIPPYIDPLRRKWSCRHCDARNKEIGRYCRKCGKPRYERSQIVTAKEFEALQRQLLNGCSTLLHLPPGWHTTQLPQQRYTTYSEARLDYLERRTRQRSGLVTFHEELARYGMDLEAELRRQLSEKKATNRRSGVAAAFYAAFGILCALLVFWLLN